MFSYKMYPRNLISTILFIAGLINYSASEFEPAYLKVCGKEHKHSVESKQCSKGVWLKESIEPGCVCVRGVWAISNGFCDDKAVIIVGDGHCYHISFQIRSAKLIGDPKDPFHPKVYVAPITLDAFYEVKENEYTPPLQSDETVIIGVNPRQVAQRKDFAVCLDLEPDEYVKPVHIYFNPRRTQKEWVLNAKKTFQCPVVTPYQYHVAFGEMFTKNKVEPKLLVERHCQEDCPSDERRHVGRALSGTSTKAKSNPAAGRSIPPVGSESPPSSSSIKPMKTIEERNREREEMRARVTQDKEDYEKETNEQTLRMMHAHISPLLLNIPGQHVNTMEYKYFQLVRQVVEKACPNDYVPKLVLRGLMRMFRQLLWETQATFTHSEGTNPTQFKNIMDALGYCLNMTREPAVLFATYSEAWLNDTDQLPLPKQERCPTPLIYAINGTEHNYTLFKPENLFVRNVSSFDPALKFNASQVDFVIEAAWKVALIGHDQCSKYFNDSQAAEYSQFFHQVQSFFNPKIMKRWFYEKSVQSTYRIVEMIFPSYDLKKFMFGMDACFFGAHSFGRLDYISVYLKRPQVPNTENDITGKRHILPGSTSPLSTLDYAPFPPLKPGDEQGVRPKEKKPAGKRRKRSPASWAYSYYLWEDRARCIESYMEPVTRDELGYHLPTGCVTPTPI